MRDVRCRPAWPPRFIATAAPADRTVRADSAAAVGLLQRIQNAAAGRRRHRRPASCRLRLRGRIADDRTRRAVVAREPGQQQAGHEEADREDRRHARQQVGGAAARHEAGTSAHTKTAALGLLQQHRRDQDRNDHQVDYDNDTLHRYLPSQARMPASGVMSGLRGLNSRGVTRLNGALSPLHRVTVS